MKSTWLRAGFLSSMCLGACAPHPAQSVVKTPATPPPTALASAPRPAASSNEPPPSSAVSALKPFPTIASFSLQNGVTLDLIERRSLPVVSLTLVMAAGQSKDGSHAAVAQTTAQLLEAGGAGRFTSTALRQTVDGLGSSLETLTTRDTSRFSLSVTSDKLSEALEILAAIAQIPRFDAAEFGKLRTRELERVRGLSKESGGWLAQVVLTRELYATPLGVHPYASVDVLPSELLRLTLAECKKFHKAEYIPRNARLVAVGDVDLETLKAQAERHFGAWRGSAPQELGIAQPNPPTKMRVVLVDRPGSAQSDVVVGLFGPPRSDANFPAIAALQQVLGGGVSGRLFLDVREKRSLAYSTRTGTQETIVGPSVLSLSAGTQTAKTAETVSALLENLERMQNDPASEQELEVAKSYLVRGMPASWETVGALSGQLVQLKILGQPDRHYDELRQAIETLTPQSVKAVAAQYYRKDNAVVVVAGDATAVGESLRKFGSVEVLDPQKEFAISRKLSAK